MSNLHNKCKSLDELPINPIQTKQCSMGPITFCD